MNFDDFNRIVDGTFDTCRELLIMKGEEYSKGYDRLDQFKKATTLTGQYPINNLAGMMVKHTTKLYDFVDKKGVSEGAWNEVIHDHINYLILLKALLQDEGFV